MIERYEELVRENKRLRSQLETFRHSHYQTQAARRDDRGEGSYQPLHVRRQLLSRAGSGGDRADRRRHAGGQPMTTNMMGRTFWIWLAITLFTACLFGLLDLIFKKSTPMDGYEAGFIAFVVLWCARQDQLRKTAPR